MATFELRFKDMIYVDDYIKAEKATYPSTNQDYILVTLKTNDSDFEQEILLDKSTAIKFAKTLRTEINKITESEVNNG